MRSSSSRMRAFPALSSLGVEEKVGQLLAIRIDGARDPGARVFELVRRGRLGGVVLFGGDAGEVALLTERLQAASPVPILVASDLERGAGQQFAGATSVPGPMAIAAGGLPEHARAAGRVSASEARLLGVNMLFAPVLDVNTHADNPIIGNRAFSDRPATVSLMGLAFCAGVAETGLLPTVKHFPGHGGVAADSHVELPVAVSPAGHGPGHLEPFARAVDAGVAAVMTAHVAYPSLDASGFPATFSPPILTGLLRERMGFSGLIVSDALDMAALSRFPPGEREILSLEAGVDVLLLPEDLEAAHRGVVEAVRRGRIREALLTDRVARVLEARARLPVLEPLSERRARFGREVGSPTNADAAATIARSSITGLALTGPRSGDLDLFVMAGDGDWSAFEPFLKAAYRHARPRTVWVEPDDRGRLPRPRPGVPLVLAVSFSPRAQLGRSGPMPEQLEQCRRLIEEGSGRTAPLVASMGCPFLHERLGTEHEGLIAYDMTLASQEALAEAAFRTAHAPGRLPVRMQKARGR